MNDRELMFLPAHEQRQMILDGKITSVELTEASLRRIGDLNSQLNAFVTIDEQGALEVAAECDRKLASGDATGSLAGCSHRRQRPRSNERVAHGSWMYRIRRLGAGLRLRGGWTITHRRRSDNGARPTLPEFGNSAETFTDLFPSANNPWDVTRHPGRFERRHVCRNRIRDVFSR